MIPFLYLKQIFTADKVLKCILLAVVPALIIYVSSILFLKATGFELLQIIRDPAQQTGQSSFLGFVSNIGVWLWISSAAICFFAVLAGRSIANNDQRRLLFLIGILSLTLGFDDLFMIHDRYVSQKICFLAYAVFAGALLVLYKKAISEIAGFAFLLASFLLAMSIATDLVQDYIPFKYTHIQMIEEGFKFTGGATWLFFSSRVAINSLSNAAPSIDPWNKSKVEKKTWAEEIMLR